MQTGWKWLLALTAVLVLAGVGAGAFLLGRIVVWPWRNTRTGITGPFPGMCHMGGGFGAGCGYPPAYGGTPRGTSLTLEGAREAVERYLVSLGLPNLEVHEVMQFERNFYAIVSEKDTGIGAFELLVDPFSGAVGPEPGPNMMWNARYGMMGWRLPAGQPRVSAEEALRLAQQWLDQNLPGVEARSDDVDPFYGYYTLHVWKDGQIFGMLSVNAQTGQVWYHTWHGAFIAMLEGEEESQ